MKENNAKRVPRKVIKKTFYLIFTHHILNNFQRDIFTNFRTKKETRIFVERAHLCYVEATNGIIKTIAKIKCKNRFLSKSKNFKKI